MKLVEMRKDIETFLTKLEKQELFQIDYFTFALPLVKVVSCFNNSEKGAWVRYVYPKGVAGKQNYCSTDLLNCPKSLLYSTS